MDTASRKALIIDDETGLRRSLSFGLMQNGFSVDDAENGVSALLKLESSFNNNDPYNYIISDIVLPDINGLKLLEVIKSKHPQLPVIMISGYGTKETTDEVNERNGDAFLHKPFQIEELIDVIDHVAPYYAEKPAVVEQLVPASSVSTYALIRISETCNPMTVFQKLYMMDHVLYCDAVRENYDIILLLNGSSYKELEQFINTEISGLKDIVEIDLLPVKRPQIDKGIQEFIQIYERQTKLTGGIEKPDRLNQSLLGYVFLEIDRLRINEIYPRLYFLNSVISCDLTEGRFNFILLIRGQSFMEMNRFVQDKIRPIDGVLRSNLMHIINIIDT